jgi:ribosomal subunit interface protein
MTHQGSEGKILVQSHNVDINEPLREHARQKINEITSKYFGTIIEADVYFRKEGDSYACSIRLKVGDLPSFASESIADDVYASFDLALEKVAKQLRRKKQEVRDDKGLRHKKPNFPKGTTGASRT